VSGAWIAAFLVLAVLVALLGLLVLGTLRRISLVLERAESHLAATSGAVGPGGLEPGSPLPRFEVATVEGATLTDADLRGKASIFVFVRRGCPACLPLIDQLKGGEAARLGLQLVAVAEEEALADELASAAGVTAIPQPDRSLASAFQTTATPHAFAITASGLIAESGFPNSVEQLEVLAELVREGGDVSRERHSTVLTT
jgi:peroxiredoxin